MTLRWTLPTCLLALCVLFLLLYLLVLRRSIREAAEALEEKLRTDTNTLISISTGDRTVRALASQINRQLQSLRRERLRLQTGNDELTTAVTNISHDLRTPLTALCGYLDLLEQEPQSDRRAVPLFRHHRHGGYAAAGAGLRERHPGTEPGRLLRRAVRPGHHAGDPDAGAGGGAGSGCRGAAAGV